MNPVLDIVESAPRERIVMTERALCAAVVVGPAKTAGGRIACASLREPAGAVA